MKHFLSVIPGFRSGVLWKKVLSVIIHSFLLFLFIVIFTMPVGGITPNDHLIERIIMVFGGICFIILPYMLLTNIFNLRTKLPLFKTNTVFRNILGTILSVVLIFIMFGTGSVALEGYYSPEYKVEKEVKRQAQLAAEQDAQAKAKSEKEARLKEELEAQEKAKIEKEAWKQAELEAEAKVEADKAAQAEAKKQAEEDAKAKALAAEQLKKQEELNAKAKAQAEKAAQEQVKELAAQEAKKKAEAEKAVIEAFGKERGISNFELAKAAYKAFKEREAIIAEAKEYSYNELLKSANGTLKGKPVRISGDIIFIRESTNFAGNVTGTILLIKDYYGNVYGAHLHQRTMECNKGDYIDIFGKVDGYTETTNAFGGKSQVPEIDIVEYDAVAN